MATVESGLPLAANSVNEHEAVSVNEHEAVSESNAQSSAAAEATQPSEMEGFLQKFSVGRSFFSGSNWKRRYFKLCGQQLQYFDPKCTKPKGSLDLSVANVRVVTCPSPMSHEKVRFYDRDIVIIFPESGNKEVRLVVRCSSETDHANWSAALSSRVAKNCVNLTSDGAVDVTSSTLHQ